MEWIKTKEKLPPDNKYVFVATLNGKVFIAKIDYFDPNYINEKTWYIQGAPWRGGNWDKSPEKSNIKYWMQLPKAPK